MLALALQSTLIPALSGVALIASTFTQEKENGTLVPLLASPVRDIDIVIGKLIGMVGPVMLICAGSLAVFYVLGSMLFGATRIGHALPPEIMYSVLVVAFLYLMSAGSWSDRRRDGADDTRRAAARRRHDRPVRRDLAACRSPPRVSPTAGA